MKRLAALAIFAAPIAAASLTAAPVAAQSASSSALSSVQQHLKSVNTMTARFTQTGRGGQAMSGDLTMKRPGKIRFDYGKGVGMLVVADGKRLNMIDYDVKQVQSWPIGESPLSVLLNPNQDLARFAKVVQNDGRVVMVEARDPKRPELGRITIAFAKVAGAPAGLMMQGWVMVDSQNNRTTVKLSNQKFNVAVADSKFRYSDPRKTGPRG